MEAGAFANGAGVAGAPVELGRIDDVDGIGIGAGTVLAPLGKFAGGVEG